VYRAGPFVESGLPSSDKATVPAGRICVIPGPAVGDARNKFDNQAKLVDETTRASLAQSLIALKLLAKRLRMFQSLKRR